jgi:NAD(P)H dehydrogenase (quinone)
MIVVTGAAGKLGRLVIEELLKTVPAKEIVAAVRTPAKAQELAAKGVTVREADYTRPETLKTAFAGAKRLLLISSNELGVRRIDQHKAVIDAVKAAGVERVAYTSLLHADTTSLGLARDHLATEDYLRASGVAFALLRNGWYMENQTESLAPALEHGAILGAARNGHIAGATRRDYAAAAAKVLTAETQTRQVYELAGDEPYTLSDLAAEVTRQSGRQVVYTDLPQQKYAKELEKFGLPKTMAEFYADCDRGIAQGDLDDNSHDLSRLIGRPTAPLSAAVAAALKM